MRLFFSWDQGSELSEHAIITAVLAHVVFFAHSVSPLRGSNENASRLLLLLEHFPKDTELGLHALADLQVVEEASNNRPLKLNCWNRPARIKTNPS